MVVVPVDFQSHLGPYIEHSVAPDEDMVHVFIVFLAKDAPVEV